MKREELPGFVRELPITILTILIHALVLASVFWPLYSHYRKKAEESRARDAQEMTITDESPEDDSDEPGADGDAESYSD